MEKVGIDFNGLKTCNLAIMSVVFFCLFNLSAATLLSIKCSSVPHSSVPSIPVVYCENLPRSLRHRLLVKAPSPGPSHDHKVFIKENNDIKTAESVKRGDSVKENSSAHMMETGITESKEVARPHRMKIESAAVGGIIIGVLVSTVIGALLCYVRVTRQPVS